LSAHRRNRRRAIAITRLLGWRWLRLWCCLRLWRCWLIWALLRNVRHCGAGHFSTGHHRGGCRLICQRYGFTKPDHVAGAQRTRTGQSLPVDERAVGAAEVFNRIPTCSARHPHVMATDLWIIDNDVVGDVPTQRANVFVEVVNLVWLRTSAGDQPEAVVALNHKDSPPEADAVPRDV